ncbi:MAG: diguanylate cyclase [Anaerolineales bacterium]|nr:diguanylate cyclase [Anaerolineales bacterium]
MIEEVRGKIPRLLRSDNPPRTIYPEPWQTIQSGKEWRGEFLAHKKNGESYWSSASISPIFDPNGNITHFVSVNRRYYCPQSGRRKDPNHEHRTGKLAATDYLTGLHNRRYFMQRGVDEFKRAIRNNHPLALLMLDVDEFKKVNDTYGHEVGDTTLHQFAAPLNAVLREIDILGRLGGEEFAVLLPNTSLEDAFVLAERIRQTIANTTFEELREALSITTSIGVTALYKNMTGIDDMLRNADTAMYQAKNGGRNRVMKFIKD